MRETKKKYYEDNHISRTDKIEYKIEYKNKY